MSVNGRDDCNDCSSSAGATGIGGVEAAGWLIQSHDESPMDSQQVHLWFCDYGAINDVDLLSAYRELLSPEERKQEARFYFPRDRRRFLVTRALVRTVLSLYVPTEPRALKFAVNEFGRPEISNEEARTTRICFNLSHTHSLIVLGIAKNRALGVDVENAVSRAAPLEIAGHFFSAEEVTALSAIPREERQHRFFEFWTFKEAYIKARGLGLSCPLDKFSFRFASPGSVDVNIDSELGDTKRWHFWQFRQERGYLIAICAERVDEPRSSLRIRDVVPLRSVRTLSLMPSRAS